MKIIPSQFKVSRELEALTLVELLVSLSIFGLMLAGLITINLFGMKQDTNVSAKLGANDQSRHALTLLLSEVQSSKNVLVGTGTRSSFTPVADGLPLQGNALQIYPFANDPNFFVRYYYDTGTNVMLTNGINTDEFRRIVSGQTNYKVILRNLTNSTLFKAMDYAGNTLTQTPTNSNFSYVIDARFQFYQYLYPLTKVGPGYYYDTYSIKFKATRR
ncbi:MAG: hypothetical protein JWQ71_1962, partial [Pedosphaera sp.]|nr:hypothetical protein [Pedosphaera sp.]